MNGSGAMQRAAIFVLGLVAGIFLFAATFSVLLDNMIFNGPLQKQVLEKLGVSENISEVITTLTSESGTLPNEFKPVKNGISSDFVSQNANSLIDGLIEYFRGNTKLLPDLNLTGISNLYSLNNTDGTGALDSMSRTITGPETINLRALFMYFGERRITLFLLVICLIQFILAHIPSFSLLIFVTLFVLMLCKTRGELRSWLQYTSLTYSILCMVTGFLIQLTLFYKMPYLLSLTDKYAPLLKGVLSNYITYFTGSITIQNILSGTFVFGVVHAFMHTLGRTGQIKYINTSLVPFSRQQSFDSITNMNLFQNKSFTPKTSIIIVILVILSSAALYTEARAASLDFASRNLGQAVSFLKGNSLYDQVTEARKDLVCLLEVKVLDSITKQPVENLEARVVAKDDSKEELLRCETDSDGAADFLLEKGSFKLILDSINPLASYSLPDPLSYDFEMATPGKTELTIILNKEASGLSSIEKASMQYLP